ERLANGRKIACDHGARGGHRLQDGDREALVRREVQDDVAPEQGGAELVARLPTTHVDSTACENPAIRPVAQPDELGPKLRAEATSEVGDELRAHVDGGPAGERHEEERALGVRRRKVRQDGWSLDGDDPL